ncbi:MAG: ClpXP protease specificity-enhancing factor SspB, partial [Alphaproteobacteria bacterium]|nr:ClpXP protease specificity-enhancing factor SspB [Alphaproteobacteria bacterium]
MSDTKLDYGAMMERARHGVARQALELVRDHGLPGGHHFYITFRTGDPGVEIDDFLQRRFPDEMTIILQHQYWDLAVDGHGFSVVLSFDDRSAKLTVPYTALAAFVDPSVGFILQF